MTRLGFRKFEQMVENHEATNEFYFAVNTFDGENGDTEFYDDPVEAMWAADHAYACQSKTKKEGSFVNVVKFPVPDISELSENMTGFVDSLYYDVGHANAEEVFCPTDLEITEVDDFFDEVIIPRNAAFWRVETMHSNKIVVTDNAGRETAYTVKNIPSLAKLWHGLHMMIHNIPMTFCELMQHTRIYSELSTYYIIWE